MFCQEPAALIQSNVLLPPVHPILTYNQCTTAPLTQLAIVAPSQMLNALLKYSHRTASYLVMRDSCILLYINTSINICVYTYIIYIYIICDIIQMPKKHMHSNVCVTKTKLVNIETAVLKKSYYVVFLSLWTANIKAAREFPRAHWQTPHLCGDQFELQSAESMRKRSDKDSTLVRCLNGPNEPMNYDGRFISKLRHCLMLQWTQIPSSGGTS